MTANQATGHKESDEGKSDVGLESYLQCLLLLVKPGNDASFLRRRIILAAPESSPDKLFRKHKNFTCEERVQIKYRQPSQRFSPSESMRTH